MKAKNGLSNSLHDYKIALITHFSSLFSDIVKPIPSSQMKMTFA